MNITTPADVTHAFRYHEASGDQAMRYQVITEAAEALARAIMQQASHSRERSLALTKLQECRMWANAGIAVNGDGAAPLAANEEVI